MSDIQSKIFNVIAATVVFIVFCFTSSWILFEFKGSATSLKDTWSIVSSLFSGATTLVAAYIASLLFNDWRDEKNYDLENQHLTSILLGLRDIHAELLEMQSSSKTIQRTNEILISYSAFITRQRLDIQNTINKLKADLTIYSKITGHTNLLDLLADLQENCKTYDNQYNQLIHHYYRGYLDELYGYFNENKKNTPDIKEKSSFERIYVQDEKHILSIPRKNILIFFKLKPMDDYAAKAINSHGILLQECSNFLRP